MTREPNQGPPGALRMMWPPRDPVKDFACISMVRDEEFFLRIWFKHYLDALPGVEFTVVDHASKVPVRELVAREFPTAKVNVIDLPDVPFDAAYKGCVLSALSCMALHAYRAVISTDIDELVIAIGPENRQRPMGELILEQPGDFAAPIGMEFIQHPAEGPFDVSRGLLEQRDYVVLASGYSKPAIWKGQPAAYAPGQHRINKEYQFAPSLGLAHLRYVDEALARERQQHRASTNFSENHVARDRHRHWIKQADDPTWRGGWLFKRLAGRTEFGNADEVLQTFLKQLQVVPQKDGGFGHDIKLATAEIRYSELTGTVPLPTD